MSSVIFTLQAWPARRRLPQRCWSPQAAGACGGRSPGATAGARRRDSPAATAHRLPEVLGQPDGRQASASWLETRPARTSTIKWVEFPAGPQILEALAVGSLEFGLHRRHAAGVRAGRGQGHLVTSALEPPKPASSADPRADTIRRLNAPLADLKGRKRGGCRKGRARTTCSCGPSRRRGLQWSRHHSRSTSRRRTRAPPSSAARSMPGASGTRTTRPPRSTVQPRVLSDGRGPVQQQQLLPRFARARERGTRTLIGRCSTRSREADRLGAGQRARETRIKPDRGCHRPAAGRRHDPASSSAAPPAPSRRIEGLRTVADQQRVADAFRTLALIPRPVDVAPIVWRPAARVAASRP